MSTWKKILTEDDGNLATKNLSISSGTSRAFNLETASTGATVLAFQHNPSAASTYGILSIIATEVSGTVDQGVVVQGALTIQGNADGSTDAGTLVLKESGSSQDNFTAFKCGSMSTNISLTMPTAGPTSNGQVLAGTVPSSGEVTLSWVDNAGGGGGSIDGSGGTDRIAIWSDSDTLTSDSEITYTAATHKIQAGSFTATVVSGVAATGLVSCQTLNSGEINVGFVSTQTVGLFGTGSRLLVKGGSFQGTLSAGRVMRYSQGQGTNPITTADHTSAAAATTMLFCTTDAADPQELLLEGSIRVATNQGWSTAAQGTPLYLGSSSGTLQSSPPTTQGYYSRIVGYVLDASNAIIYFCPDRSWVKIA